MAALFEEQEDKSVAGKPEGEDKKENHPEEAKQEQVDVLPAVAEEKEEDDKADVISNVAEIGEEGK